MPHHSCPPDGPATNHPTRRPSSRRTMREARRRHVCIAWRTSPGARCVRRIALARCRQRLHRPYPTDTVATRKPAGTTVTLLAVMLPALGDPVRDERLERPRTADEVAEYSHVRRETVQVWCRQVVMEAMSRFPARDGAFLLTVSSRSPRCRPTSRRRVRRAPLAVPSNARTGIARRVLQDCVDRAGGGTNRAPGSQRNSPRRARVARAPGPRISLRGPRWTVKILKPVTDRATSRRMGRTQSIAPRSSTSWRARHPARSSRSSESPSRR